MEEESIFFFVVGLHEDENIFAQALLLLLSFIVTDPSSLPCLTGQPPVKVDGGDSVWPWSTAMMMMPGGCFCNAILYGDLQATAKRSDSNTVPMFVESGWWNVSWMVLAVSIKISCF